MILKNAKIYSEGLVRIGAILIDNGIINTIKFNPKEKDIKKLIEKNNDRKEINCQNKLILPGIIDIHSHLRDMNQVEKETFSTGTKAAAFSGITTVFNMPNTKPPAITAEQVKKWMKKAQDSIFINVGFIAGVPQGIDEGEIKKIIDLGVIGFKIYPLKSLNGINWTKDSNIQKILNISSKYNIPIFIHPDSPILEKKRIEIYQNWLLTKYSQLELHNKLFPHEMEIYYIRLIIHNYLNYIENNRLSPENYPIIHFCHISSKNSFDLIDDNLTKRKNLRITYEITPHHLLLSKTVNLKNDNFGKVLPPLREKYHSKYLFNKLKEGIIEFIATDHAPHTVKEKSGEFVTAPSGFPGFETYPLVLLDKVCRYKLSLENFVKVASENPAKKFNLKNKGFIKEGYDADLFIIEKVPEYSIKSQKFKTKAKFSPFENYNTSIQIWKVLLKGIEINSLNSIPSGQIIKRGI